MFRCITRVVDLHFPTESLLDIWSNYIYAMSVFVGDFVLILKQGRPIGLLKSPQLLSYCLGAVAVGVILSLTRMHELLRCNRVPCTNYGYKM